MVSLPSLIASTCGNRAISTSVSVVKPRPEASGYWKIDTGIVDRLAHRFDIGDRRARRRAAAAPRRGQREQHRAIGTGRLRFAGLRDRLGGRVGDDAGEQRLARPICARVRAMTSARSAGVSVAPSPAWPLTNTAVMPSGAAQ